MRRSLAFTLVASLFALLFGCALGPTRVTDHLSDRPASIQEWAPPGALVLDVRSAAQVLTGRVPGSRPVRWQDFQDANPALRGFVSADHQGSIERLARWGAQPDRVIVLIQGADTPRGTAEQMAWTLRALGIRSVLIRDFATYQGRIEAGEIALSLDQAPPWTLPVELIRRLDVQELKRGMRAESRSAQPQILRIGGAEAQSETPELLAWLQAATRDFDRSRPIWLTQGANFPVEQPELLGRVAWHLGQLNPTALDIRLVPLSDHR